MFQIQREKRAERKLRLIKQAEKDKLAQQLKDLQEQQLKEKALKQQFDLAKIAKELKENVNNEGFIPESPGSTVDAYMNITSPHVCHMPLNNKDNSSGDEITVPTSPAMPTAK